jgi:hypothetical protein
LVPIVALQNAPRRESVADEYNPFRRARLAITLAWFLRGWKKVGVPWKSRLGFESPRHGHLLAVPGNGYDFRFFDATDLDLVSIRKAPTSLSIQGDSPCAAKTPRGACPRSPALIWEASGICTSAFVLPAAVPPKRHRHDEL